MKKKMMICLMASAMMFTLVGCEVPEIEELSDIGEMIESELSSDSDFSIEELFEESSAEGSSDEMTEEESAAEATSEEPMVPDNSFEYNGKTVSVNDDIDTILSVIGTEENQTGDESGNIYYIDTDRMVLFTEEVDGVKSLGQLTIHDENVKTARGISVGSTEEEVRAAYGEPSSETMEGSHILNYDFEDCGITFALDEKVVAITYFKQ